MRLDDLTADVGAQAERWAAVRDQIRDGTMPPKKEPRPDEGHARAVVAWIASASGHGAGGRLPNQGNLIPHEALFGHPAGPVEPPAPRVWRLSPDAYMGFVRDLTRGRVPVVQPFTALPERGIKDFAGLFSIDEQSTQILLRNAESIVEAQTACEVRDGQVRGKNDTVREFVALMNPAGQPTRQQLETAVQKQFKMAIGRTATEDEVGRLIGLYEKCATDGDRPAAVRTMLQAVLLRADALFRLELGAPAGEDGRRMLAPTEAARAISLAVGDRRDPAITQAALKGELTTREQIAGQVRRVLDDPKADKGRLLRFFREYFDHRASEVFKDKPADRIKHLPAVLVADTDRLVLHVLAQDKDVFRQLLTTPVSFVNSSTKQNKQTRKDELVQADVLPRPDPKRSPEWLGGVTQVYGLAEWPSTQPAPLPAETRIGVLMQPSWLVAFSTNFDNDPVRRGRWVRERLLGGTVPDLPIGVPAQVPDEPHRTFRDRLTSVTRQGRCWTCHQRMDDLGLPFENFDHYGRFRTAEAVRDVEATAKNVDKKGKPLGPVTKDAPLVMTGLIADSGDPALDGPVADPREMIRRIANSDRARQVFVRHAFRYFLGRNETLADAKTLQDADRAYVASGGSFKALVVSLLTSESFLYRSTPSQPAAAGDHR